MKNYPITKDVLFNNFIKSRPGLSAASYENYKFTLTKFCSATDLTLEEIINNCKSQQNRVIEKIIKTTITDNEEITEKEIIEFDVNSPTSKINQYIDAHINYCKEKGNTNSTINNNLDVISVFLDYYNIKLPNIKKLPSDKQTWYPLTKEDIKFIMQDSTITHQSLISTLKSSGLRLKDAVTLTIGDFITGTKDYHNCVSVDEFIDNAPQDMICTLQFNPHKTKRFNLECITFIDFESCNLILQNLRRIKNEYLPGINKKYDLNLTLSKDDALFGNQRQYFKGHITTHNLSDLFNKKNKKLREHRINKIKEQIQNNELSEEDFDKEVEKIPKFHAHALRKFFSSTIATNCGNLRICAIMEGHTSPLKTDDSYIKINVDEIKEAYMAAIPDLSLENTDVKVYTSDVRREMEQKINSLEKELEEKEEKVSNIEKRLAGVDDILARLDKLEQNK